MTDTTIFKSVLLIEDEAAHALLIKRALSAYCEQIMTADSAAEAEAKLGEQNPDLIVSDLNLPDMSGRGLIEKICSLSSSPVIVLTSSTSVKDAVSVIKCGARDFLVKDFDSDFGAVLGAALARLEKEIQLEREGQKYREAIEVLQQAIENGHDALAVVETDGTVEYANYAFREFVSRCGGEQHNISTVFSEAIEDHRSLQESVMMNLRTLSRGAIWSTEISFTEDSDTCFQLSISVIKTDNPVIENASGHRYVVWVREISELKRRERFQREIISTTSHDLKGPLGAITLSAEMLKEELEEGSRGYEINLRLCSSAQGAINLIDEFLSARRLQEGSYILKPDNYAAVQLIQEVLNNYEAIATARKIGLESSVAEGIRLNVDKIGFERVIGNLLGNALKFTPAGGQISIKLKARESGVTVEVRDTGCGMEASEVKQIFDRFSRLDKHQGVAGTGLGLFVVKNIVSAHGGKIGVTSQLKEGTCFEIFFPNSPPVNERGELILLDFA